MKSLLSVLMDGIRLPFRRARPARGLSTDAATRKGELHGLAAEITRAVAGAKLRSIVQRGRREELERAALERATKQAVANLGQMKGLTMKLGQQASYLNALPEEAERELESLQAHVPPLEPAALEGLLSSVFGKRLKEAFRDFDRTPIAAASIGQVHRAELKDGRKVAVKLQYPGVAEAMRADLQNLEALTAVSALTMKSDMSEYTRSLNESFLRELDYEAEQRNQQRLADLYRGHPHVLIPEPVAELCGPTVLVTELVEGSSLREVAASADQAERDRFGEVMYRFAFGCIASGFFSGDPHPGNYIFAADGRVAFIDFGMVIELHESQQSGAIAEMLAGALGQDAGLLSDAFSRLGLLPAGVDAQALWSELEPLVAGPIAGGVVRIDREQQRAAVESANEKKTSALGVALRKSPELQGWMLLWLRYALGALATISKLEPAADWRQILSEVVLGAEPVGEIGRGWGDAPGGHDFRGSRFQPPQLEAVSSATA